MGYGGYLVKFGNYTIPNSLIKQDTFSSYVNMQDLDLGRYAKSSELCEVNNLYWTETQENLCILIFFAGML